MLSSGTDAAKPDLIVAAVENENLPITRQLTANVVVHDNGVPSAIQNGKDGAFNLLMEKAQVRRIQPAVQPNLIFFRYVDRFNSFQQS